MRADSSGQLICGVGATVLYTISAAAFISSNDGRANVAGEAPEGSVIVQSRISYEHFACS